MLVENTEPRARGIGNLYLIPGVNRIDVKRWEYLKKSGYARAIQGLIDDGTLVVTENDSKVTVSLVAKTYDPDLLESWLDDAKGPLKGAIKKQLKLLTEDEEGEVL